MKKLEDIIAKTRQLDPPSSLRRPPLSRAQWEEAVGARVAARTEPYRLERGVLFVRVATAAWANELTMLTEPIIQQLRASGVELDTVRFNVGRVAPPEPPRRPPAQPPPAVVPALPSAIAEMVAAIETPELRRAVSRAAARHLAQAGADHGTEDGSDGRGRPAQRSTTQRAAPADRARESPTAPPVSPSPPPASVTRLSREKPGK